MNTEDVDKMVALYESGKSAREAAGAFGMHTSSAYYHLKLRGVRRRSQSISSRMGHGGTLNDHAFDYINPESAYWLGFLMTDGSVQNRDDKSRWQMKIELAICDIDHIEKFRTFMGASNPIYINKKGNSATIMVNSKYLVNKVADYDIVPNKTFIAKAPDALKYDRDFFRGCVCGDGTLFVDCRGCPRVGLVGAYDLVSDFKEFAAQYVTSRTKVNKARNIFSYNLNSDNALRMMEVLYQDDDVYYLDRKRKLAYELTGRTPPN